MAHEGLRVKQERQMISEHTKHMFDFTHFAMTETGGQGKPNG